MKITFCLILILFVAVFLSACGGGSSAPENNTANVSNAANAKSPAASPGVAASTQSPIVAPTVNASADSAAPCNVYAAYYAALLKKDEAALQKTLTRDSIRQLKAEAAADGDNTIVENLTAYSAPSPKMPACGGAIQGDAAMLQTKDAETGVVTMLRAVKENGEWKLDLLSVGLK